MRKIFYLVFAVAAYLLCSCSRDMIEEQPIPQDGEVAVTLPICCSKQMTITRSTDESQIADVNLFLVQDQVIQRHVYATTPTVHFWCPVGKYQLFVIANHHANMGELNYDQLIAYTLQTQDRYDDLPMCATQEIEVADMGAGLTLPMLEVQRMVAKINYSIKVDPAVSDIELKSVQIMSLPKMFSPFQDLTAFYSPMDYFDSPITATANKAHFDGSFYMLPNLQGNVTSILRPELKIKENAPAMATYLRIRALRAEKVLDYCVYLGDSTP